MESIYVEHVKNKENCINKYGKKSVLEIYTKLKDGEAIISDVYYTAPFKIMCPFRINDTKLKVMILSASAGIMEGDTQEIFIDVGKGTNLEVTSQSYEKIHKMINGSACRNTKILVRKDASLIYNPKPTIPFENSSFKSKLQIDLEDNTSKAIIVDILSCGRVARGESFKYKSYINLVEVRQHGKLICRENSVYNPKALNTSMNDIGMYENYTHCATMTICNYNIDDHKFTYIRELLDYNNNTVLNGIGGITKIKDDNVVVKILGYNSEELLVICEKIIEIITTLW